MLCIRLVVLLLSVVLFVLALVAACPVPYFIQNISSFGQKGDSKVTLWSINTGAITSVAEDGTTTITPASKPVRFSYFRCTQMKSHFRALQGFAIVGTVVGFYAALISVLQTCRQLKVKVPLAAFLGIAFFCEFMLTVLAAAAYSKTFCKDTPVAVVSFKTLHKITIGFFMPLIACIGYFVAMVLSLFSQRDWSTK